MRTSISYFKLSILAIVIAGLGACATAKEVMTPNGKLGYYIKCNGTAVSMDVCYSKAAEVCPKGYEILDKNNKDGIVVNPYMIGSTSRKGIFIECKE